MIRRPAKLHYAAALHRMFTGSQLIRTNGKRAEYELSPGGPVSGATAEMIIEHSLCHPVDAGLLDNQPQTWRFHQPPQ
jgi:hypothetical protein